MTDEQRATINECAAASAAGTISFGDGVGPLMKAGVERYHADSTRPETTYYLPNGDSHVVQLSLTHPPIANTFSATAVQQSVRQAQQGELKYPQFVAQTCAAGCVGYFVQIAGKRVQYFGRTGDVHIEWFPGAEPS